MWPSPTVEALLQPPPSSERRVFAARKEHLLSPSVPARPAPGEPEQTPPRKPTRTAQSSWTGAEATTAVQSPVTKTCLSPHYQNDCFTIARSETAGWGAFAAKTLRLGDVILREKPLMVADRSNLFDEFYKLETAAQQLALSLHANELAKPGTPLIQAIWVTNCFTVGGRQAGLFPVAARFNHACCPAHNVDYHFHHESGCLELVVKAHRVAAGEELRISYGMDRTAAELYMTYGFRCRCGACRGLSDADVRRLTSQW